MIRPSDLKRENKFPVLSGPKHLVAWWPVIPILLADAAHFSRRKRVPENQKNNRQTLGADASAIAYRKFPARVAGESAGIVLRVSNDAQFRS